MTNGRKAATFQHNWAWVLLAAILVTGCNSPRLSGDKEFRFFLRGSWGSFQEKSSSELVEMRMVDNAKELTEPTEASKILVIFPDGVTKEFPCATSYQFTDNIVGPDAQGRVGRLGVAEDLRWVAYISIAKPIAGYRIMISGKIRASQKFNPPIKKWPS